MIDLVGDIVCLPKKGGAHCILELHHKGDVTKGHYGSSTWWFPSDLVANGLKVYYRLRYPKSAARLFRFEDPVEAWNSLLTILGKWQLLLLNSSALRRFLPEVVGADIVRHVGSSSFGIDDPTYYPGLVMRHYNEAGTVLPWERRDLERAVKADGFLGDVTLGRYDSDLGRDPMTERLVVLDLTGKGKVKYL